MPTLRKNLYKIANGFSFKEWKANARGVDINRNYAEGFNRRSQKHRRTKCPDWLTDI